MRNKNCRVCSGQEAPINIFEPENIHLVRQIHSITGVELSDRVELSSHLCLVCLGDLNAALKFRQRCIISEKQNLERIDTEDSPIECPSGQHEEIDDTEIELYFSQNDGSTLHTEPTEPIEFPGEVEEEAPKKPKPKPGGRGGPHVCGDCGKSINSWTNFLEHKLRHTGIKDFNCQFGCGKSFVTRKELIRHNRTHTGEKPFACSYCPSRFSDSSSRQQHHRRHRDERNFQCDVCEKTFISSGCLSKHKAIHSSERQYYCEICDKSFQRKSHLHNHLTTIPHLEKANCIV